jgi:release factor glutamine methyltransferase
MLRSGGRIYYEIYELLADEMCSMLVDEGYINIRLREDFRGKKRMICAEVE